MIIKQKSIGTVSNFLLCFLIFGFPIQSFIPFILNVNSNPINVGFRLVFVVVSLVLIALHFFSRSTQKIKIGWFFFVFFWLIYTLRLIYDIQFKGVTYLQTDSFYVYSFAFGTCLIPSVATYYSAKFVNINKSVLVAYIIILISNLSLFYAVTSAAHWNISELIIKRANVNVELNGESISIINPITIGYFGELLSITAIHLLSFNLISSNRYFKALLYFSIVLGIINLILGASRGPMLSFLILLLIELYFIGKKNKFSLKFLVKTVSIIFIISFFGTYYVFSKIDKEDVELLNRLSNTAESRQSDDKEERDYLFESAWNQFIDNPIVGDSFVTKYPYSSYSHNIFLDVLMSTGIIGTIIFGLMEYYILKNISLNFGLQQNIIRLYILFFMSIILISMTSGGLFVSGNFWIFSAFLLGLNKHENC